MAELSIYVLTFNCGRMPVKPEAFAKHVFDARPSNNTSPDIIVLNLQEFAPLGYAFLGGSFVTPYFNAFRQSLKLASTDCSYVNTINRNAGMTAIMIFLRDSLAQNIAFLDTAGVGVGFQQMGNKGAAAVRIGYRTSDEQVMRMTFVSAHLAPMEGALERRNQDFQNIAKGLVFVPDKSEKGLSQDEQAEDVPLLQGMPGSHDTSPSGMYSPGNYLFFAGDLNYRTSKTPPTEEDVQKRFPQPTENLKDPKHFSHLLFKDQLTHQLRQGHTLHGFSEADINFPPTYKYHQTIGKDVIMDDEQDWNWASHRWPSWCDRILYLDHPSLEVEAHTYRALPLFSTSDHRPVALSFKLPLQPLSAAGDALDDTGKNPPFPVDRAWKAKRETARTKEIVVGLVAYLTWTYEGMGLLFATAFGVFGGYLIIRTLLAE